MKKKVIVRMLCAAGSLFLLSACGTQKSEPASEEVKEETTQEPVESVPTEAEIVDAQPAELSPTQEPTEAVPTEAGEEVQASPLMLWEYEGFVDECKEYSWWEEFADCDYDLDGKTDRLYRSYSEGSDLANYTIEFGNGRSLQVPDGWNTGFPHIQAADLDEDGEKEILFNLSYDTSTDPLNFGDMWLFHWNAEAEEYEEVELPLVAGENGAKCLTVSYQRTGDDTIFVKVAQDGYEYELTEEKDTIDYWYWEDAEAQNIMVYCPVMDEKTHRIQCWTEIFAKSARGLVFDLVFENGKCTIENMEYTDQPYLWWE